MSNTKVYLAVFIIRAMYSAMQIFSKIAFNGGMNISVFVFYRQAFATLFLAPIALILERRRAPPLPPMLCFKIFISALIGMALAFNAYSVALSYTSATLSSAAMNSVPVITFILAVLLRMEAVKLKRLSGIAKASGVVLCLFGVATMAFYKGPELNSLNHHHIIGHGSGHIGRVRAQSRKTWVLGTFMLIISNTTGALWLILQEPLLKEYPSKLMLTTLQSLFSVIQSFFIALAAERDFSKWKLGLDMGLLSVAYCGICITGVSLYLQSWCIEKRGPVFLAMSTPLTLIITIIISSLILGEMIDLQSVLGGIFMVGGLYVVLWGKSKEKRETKVPVVEDGIACLEKKEGEPSIASIQTTSEEKFFGV